MFKSLIIIWFVLEVLFYLMYISMPFVFPIDGTYNHKRVIITRLLVLISTLCSYGIGIFALGIGWCTFGWFSLLILLFINWVLLPLYIISIADVVINHSFLLLIMTIIASPTIKYHFKALTINESLRS